MYRAIPTNNKICSTKETFQNQMILVGHIQKMKPSIDNRPPKQFGFLNNRKKKEQMKQLKQNEVDRENKHLINKITNIMSHPQCNTNYTQSSIVLSQVQRSQSQNNKKSLNGDYRKKELIRIVMENQALLKRIQSQKSKYDSKHWELERKDVEKHIANISEFPYKEYKPTKTLVQQFWQNSVYRMGDSQISKKDIPRKLDPISRENEYQKQELRKEKTSSSLKQTLKENDEQLFNEELEQEQQQQVNEGQEQEQEDQQEQEQQVYEEQEQEQQVYEEEQEQEQELENEVKKEEIQDNEQLADVEKHEQIEKEEQHQEDGNQDEQIQQN